MKRSAFRIVLFLLLACFCFSAAQADTRKLTLIMIGGDSDTEESKNNLFRNIQLSYEAFADAEIFFVKSAGRDYSNAAALERTETASGYLSDDGLNVVGGYSHGGQSIFFMDMEKISDIFLIDACVSIGGKCSNPEKCGEVWADWIISTVRQGVTVHLLVSIGKHDEPSGAKFALANLKKTAEKDPVLIAQDNGWYCVLDENGNELGQIETALLAGNHKTIISLVEDQVAQYLYTLWKEAPAD